MKALVLSGGSGTRLRPLSYSMPKQLIPIAGKPVLEHVLENVRALGVTEVGVVVGDWADQITAELGDGARLGMRLTYIRQHEPLGLAHCVRLARPFLGDEDFVMYLGDNMLPEGVSDVARDFRATRPAAQVVVHQVEDPSAFGVAVVDAKGAVCHVVEKPRTPVSDLALVGVYFFTSAIHRACASVPTGLRGELEITDAIQWLLTHGAEVRASRHLGYWRDTGRVEDVLHCNRRLMSAIRPEVLGERAAGSELVGLVRVEAGARVTRSRVEGPAIIGAGTVVEDSHLGPYTALGEGCTVRDTRMCDSILLDGARVEGVRGLHGSLIGRGAVVGTGGEPDPYHRLVVGDHARIKVAA
ncbi:glucose-1-phosphate thymidylyltransferase [Streptomyces sp. NPDC059740]|uniref:glucose-1-phosphate thymidylyltransferase n=1 Tax=Streptomyces sp. NPDC059740 TaxID=3346926 RepID=UPI00364E81BD